MILIIDDTLFKNFNICNAFPLVNLIFFSLSHLLSIRIKYIL
jgi:hypothetical protein